MRYFIGALIILLGVSVLLQSSGIITDQATKDTIGSGLIVAIGVALLIWKRSAWPWAAIIIIVGLTDFVENQQWPMFEEHTPWEYIWPVFIILVGLRLFLNRGRNAIRKDSGSKLL
ncbi:MAG: hypothetical protein HY975_03915 [Candidatus Kerfeldbacteria bacterium]|nr:hypothetical protein [Candidatus Kerfeldbacteria bacterium]